MKLNLFAYYVLAIALVASVTVHIWDVKREIASAMSSEEECCVVSAVKPAK